MTNFQISKPAFTYVPVYGQNAVTNYPNGRLELPGTYFVEGQPIMAKFNTIDVDGSMPRIIITTDALHKDSVIEGGKNVSGKDIDLGLGNVYMTCCIRWANLSKTSNGSIDINSINNWTSPFIQENPQAYQGKLPPGTYKVWLIDDNGKTLDSSEFGLNPYKYIAPRLLTEPIMIKVIDPDNPDFTVKSELYAPYQGKEVDGHDNSNTRLTLEKTIFTQGEKIYYTIGMDYCARQIFLTGGHSSNLGTTSVYDDTTKGKTWQYAEHGVTTMATAFDNYLDTTGLDPGQYKLYYFMGENIQKAYRGADFSLGGNHSTYCKLYTIIDIIILPDWTHQNITVNYTKYDGTSASLSSGDLSMGGKILSTSTANGKVINKFHMGIYFNETITDIKPGTDITITATTNVHTSQAWGALEATPIVLNESKTKKYSYQ